MPLEKINRIKNMLEKSFNRYNRIAVYLSILIVFLSILAVAIFKIPFGIKGEWVWQRSVNNSFPVYYLVIVFILLVFSFSLAWFSDYKIKSLKKKIIFTALIFLLSIISNFYILKSGWTGESEGLYGIMDKWTSGYMTSAAKVNSISDYLENYEKTLRVEKGKWVLHEHTHPPGNTLLSYGVLNIVRNYPTIKKILSSSLTNNFSDFYKILKSNKSDTEFVTFNNYFYASLLIFYLFFIGIVLGNILIFTSVILLTDNKKITGLLSLILFLIPGPVLFLGHYDTFYYLLTSIAVFLFSLSLKYKRFPIYLILGFWLSVCVFFSISYGLITILIGAFLLIKYLNTKDIHRALQLLYFVLGGMIFICSVGFFLDVNIISICFKCADNNTLFYQVTVSRSAGWMLYNLVDYFLFIGCLPILFLISEIKSDIKDIFKDNILLISFLLIIVLMFMFFFPYSRGELGRLAIFIFPLNVFLYLVLMCRKKIEKIDYKLFYLFLFLEMIMVVVFRVCLKLIIYF